MSWKIEKWYEEIFPGKNNIYSEYSNLKGRELVIVAAALIDIALADILSRRLIDDQKEKETFLGLNQDGRAPIGSFGSRIQLAYLTGIITKEDMVVFRNIKKLRNHYAHTVKPEKNEKEIRQYYINLIDSFKKAISKTELWDKNRENGFEEIENAIKGSQKEAYEGLILAIITLYQAYFDLIISDVIVKICLLRKN